MPPTKDHLCQEHSGILMWMKINVAIGTVAVAMLGYSSFVQVPNLRYDLAKEMMQMETDLKNEVQAIKDRVSILETKLR